MKKRKSKLKTVINTLIGILVIGLIVIVVGKIIYINNIDNDNNDTENEQLKKYQECMQEKFQIRGSNLTSVIKEINNYLKNYEVSVGYYDINTEYTYLYDEDRTHYAASLVKLLDALYIYENKIDINTTIKYEESHIHEDSAHVESHGLNSEITIKDLIDYLITYSDNSAHRMLQDFITRQKLSEYARSIGTEKMLTMEERFGDIDVNDALVMMKRVYKFIEENKTYGPMLKGYMLNNHYNFLNINKNAPVAHKYGLAQIYFHDIGIVYDENPYIIIILTRHIDDDYATIVNSVHKEIYKLHEEIYNNKKAYCEDYSYMK